MVYGDMVCGIWYTVLEYMVYCWVFFAVLSFGSRLPQFEYMNLVRHGGADAADEDGHGDADDDGADGNTDGDAGCGDASTATTIPDTVKMEVITTLQTTAAAPTPATLPTTAFAISSLRFPIRLNPIGAMGIMPHHHIGTAHCLHNFSMQRAGDR